MCEGKMGHILNGHFIKKLTHLIALCNCAFKFRVFITFLQDICLIRHVTCDNHASYEFVCILYAHKKYFHNS